MPICSHTYSSTKVKHSNNTHIIKNILCVKKFTKFNNLIQIKGLGCTIKHNAPKIYYKI